MKTGMQGHQDIIPARVNAAMIEQIRRMLLERESASVLFELSLAINAKIDNVDEILNLILTAAIDREHLAETGSLFRFDETANNLKLLRKRGENAGFIQYSEFDIGEGIAGTVAATRKTTLVNDCSSDLNYKDYTAISEQLRSIIATPVMTPSGDKLLGVLCIHNSKSNTGFTEADQEIIEGLARIAGVAWNNALTHSKVIIDSNYDSFTTLLNGQSIEQVVNELASKASLSGQPLSVLYIDLDTLKELNDIYNSDVGDKAILGVVNAIKTNTFQRWRNRSGRWKEGDEFVVVLPGVACGEAVEIAEQIRKSVSNLHIEEIDTDLPHVTVSVGVTTLENESISGHNLVLRTCPRITSRFPAKAS